MRAKRLHMLLERFPDLARMRVIDVGGRVEFWEKCPIQPKHVTVVNLESLPPPPDWMTCRRGDVCDLPDDLDGPYDLAFSNSVIEHVGGHLMRNRMAAEIQQIADHYWVQTPYRYFPIEPHYGFPGQQLLPVRVRKTITERWPMAWSNPTGRDAVADVLGIELLGITEMCYYFPDAVILKEKVGGLIKSLIAVR